MILSNDKADEVSETFRKEFEKSGIAHKFETWLSVIKEADAFVAGGAIVAVFGDFDVDGFDIYVHFANAEKLIREIMSLGFRIQRVTECGLCGLFGNPHILMKVEMELTSAEMQMNFFVFADDIESRSVIAEFDLSFCQSWWDGDHTYSFDPDGLRKKHGLLNIKHRCLLYRDFDLALIERIHKYKKRGFVINLFDDGHQTIDSLMKSENDYEHSHEEWAVFTFADQVVNYFLNCQYENDDDDNSVCVHYQQLSVFFRVWPEHFTLHHLISKWEKIGEKRLLELTVKKVFEEESVAWENLYTQYYVDTFSVLCDLSTPLSIHDRIEWQSRWYHFWQHSIEPYL